MKTAATFVDLYECGVITEHELIYQLFDTATIEEFHELPTEWQFKLKEHIERVSVGWESLRFLNCSGSQEELRRFAKQRADYWGQL